MASRARLLQPSFDSYILQRGFVSTQDKEATRFFAEFQVSCQRVEQAIAAHQHSTNRTVNTILTVVSMIGAVALTVATAGAATPAVAAGWAIGISATTALTTWAVKYHYLGKAYGAEDMLIDFSQCVADLLLTFMSAGIGKSFKILGESLDTLADKSVWHMFLAEALKSAPGEVKSILFNEQLWDGGDPDQVLIDGFINLIKGGVANQVVNESGKLAFLKSVHQNATVKERILADAYGTVVSTLLDPSKITNPNVAFELLQALGESTMSQVVAGHRRKILLDAIQYGGLNEKKLDALSKAPKDIQAWVISNLDDDAFKQLQINHQTTEYVNMISLRDPSLNPTLRNKARSLDQREDKARAEYSNAQKTRDDLHTKRGDKTLTGGHKNKNMDNPMSPAEDLGKQKQSLVQDANQRVSTLEAELQHSPDVEAASTSADQAQKRIAVLDSKLNTALEQAQANHGTATSNLRNALDNKAELDKHLGSAKQLHEKNTQHASEATTNLQHAQEALIQRRKKAAPVLATHGLDRATDGEMRTKADQLKTERNKERIEAEENKRRVATVTRQIQDTQRAAHQSRNDAQHALNQAYHQESVQRQLVEQAEMAVQKARQHRTQAQDYLDKRNTLQAQAGQKRADVKDTASTLAQEEQTLIQLDKQLADADHALEEARQTYQRHKTEIETLQSEAEKVYTHTTQLETDYQRIKKELDEVEGLIAVHDPADESVDHDALMEQRAELERQQAELNQKYAQARHQARQVQLSLTFSEDSLTQSTQNLAQAEQNHAQSQKARAERESKVTELRQAHSTLSDAARHLEQQATEMQHEHEHALDLAKTQARIEDQLNADAEVSIGEYNRLIQEAQTHEEQAKGHEQDIEVLKSTRQGYEEQARVAQQAASQLDSEANALISLADAQSVHDHAMTNKSQAQDALTQSGEQVTDAERRLAEQGALIEEIQNNQNTAQQTVTKVKQDLEKVRQLKAHVDSVKQEVDLIDNQVNQMLEIKNIEKDRNALLPGRNIVTESSSTPSTAQPLTELFLGGTIEFLGAPAQLAKWIAHQHPSLQQHLKPAMLEVRKPDKVLQSMPSLIKWSTSKAKLPPAQAVAPNTAVLVIRSPIEVHARVDGVGEGTVPAGGELRFEVSITYSPKRRLVLNAPGRPPLTTIVELERGQSLILQAHTIDAN